MNREMNTPTRLLDEMRKQFSYSLFIFMLTVGLVVTLTTHSLEKLTPKHVAIILILYSVMQATIYMTFIRQSKRLKEHLKQED